MIGQLVAELGIGMHDVIHQAALVGEVGRHEHMVQRLQVALEVVGVALARRQGVGHVDQARVKQGLQRAGELEVVQVSGHDHIGVRVDGQHALHESSHRLRLSQPLNGRIEHRRLARTKQRLVAPLAVEVVGHHDDLLSVHRELRHQRLAAAVEGGVGRVDAPGTEIELHLPTHVAGADGVQCAADGAGEGHARGVVQERLADVATGFAAVGVVVRRDGHKLVVAPGLGVQLGRQPPQRDICRHHAVVGVAVVVLHFLQRDQVRRAQRVLDLPGDGLDPQVGRVAAQVLDVVTGHGEPVARDHCGFARQGVGHHRDRLRHVELVVGKAVVHHAGDVAQLRAAVHRGGGQQTVIELDALSVELPRADHHAAARRRDGSGSTNLGAGNDRDLAETVPRAHTDGGGQADAHAFERLVEIDGVLRGLQRVAGGRLHVAHVGCDQGRWQETGVDRPGGRQCVAGGNHRQGARERSSCADLGGRQVDGTAARPELLYPPAHQHVVAHGGFGQSAAAKDVDAVGGQRIAVATVLHPEAVVLHGGDDAGDAGDGQVGETRQVRRALERADQFGLGARGDSQQQGRKQAVEAKFSGLVHGGISANCGGR